jgi:hypothetical protein
MSTFAAHAVPAGPLSVRWLAHDIPPQRAGVLSSGRVELQNTGVVAWDSREGYGICLGYHWLDPLGNPTVWDGLLTAFPRVIAPGERVDAPLTVAGPTPPGHYRLALDLVDGGRCWFSEVGNASPEIDVEVSPRLARRRLRVQIADGPDELARLTSEALAVQEEAVTPDGEATAFLAAGCRPRPDWSRRVLDAHEEGYGVVAGAIEVEGSRLERRRLRALNACSARRSPTTYSATRAGSSRCRGCRPYSRPSSRTPGSATGGSSSLRPLELCSQAIVRPAEEERP